jgi:protein SCO1
MQVRVTTFTLNRPVKLAYAKDRFLTLSFASGRLGGERDIGEGSGRITVTDRTGEKDRTGERSVTGRATYSPALRFLVTAAMCLVLGGLVGLLAAGTKSSPPSAEPVRFVPPPGPARDFRLRDEGGRMRSLADARGDVVAMTWIYSTCRDLCPAEGNIIADAVKRVGRGVQVYVMSVDPVGDTPERVRAWLQRRGFGPEGHYLMGTRAQLAPVWRAYAIAPVNASPEEAAAAAKQADAFRAKFAAMLAKGIKFKPQPYKHPKRPTQKAAYAPYPDADDLQYRGRPRHGAGLDFEHSAYVMLIDKHGNQRVGLPFEQLDAVNLARDMRLLRDER